MDTELYWPAVSLFAALTLLLLGITVAYMIAFWRFASAVKRTDPASAEEWGFTRHSFQQRPSDFWLLCQVMVNRLYNRIPDERVQQLGQRTRSWWYITFPAWGFYMGLFLLFAALGLFEA